MTIGTDDERLFVKFAAALQDGSSTQGAFGVFPHDLRRRVSIDGAVEDARLPVDPVLVVGLHYEARRHWRKSKQESRDFFFLLFTHSDILHFTEDYHKCHIPTNLQWFNDQNHIGKGNLTLS